MLAHIRHRWRQVLAPFDREQLLCVEHLRRERRLLREKRSRLCWQRDELPELRYAPSPPRGHRTWRHGHRLRESRLLVREDPQQPGSQATGGRGAERGRAPCDAGRGRCRACRARRRWSSRASRGIPRRNQAMNCSVGTCPKFARPTRRQNRK
jgi:hypothetical protein